MANRTRLRMALLLVWMLWTPVLIGSCTRDRKLEVTVTRETQDTDQVVLSINNCDGAEPVVSEATYDTRINIEGAGDLGVGIGAIQAKLSSSLGVQSGYTIRQNVQTPPGKQGEHRVSFRVNIIEGFVTKGKRGPRAEYALTVPKSFIDVESVLEDCGNSALDDPKAHAWRCTIEITDRETGAEFGRGELVFGRAEDNSLEYARLFLDRIDLDGMARDMESNGAAWGFLGVRTDDVLMIYFPGYRFPEQPFIKAVVTKDRTAGTLELRGDLLFNKPELHAVAQMEASCRVAD